MKNPEMKVIRFASEDVIATSMMNGAHYYTTGQEWAQYQGSSTAVNASFEFDWINGNLVETGSNFGRESGNGYYAWYNNSNGTWDTEHETSDHYFDGFFYYNHPTGND